MNHDCSPCNSLILGIWKLIRSHFGALCLVSQFTKNALTDFILRGFYRCWMIITLNRGFKNQLVEVSETMKLETVMRMSPSEMMVGPNGSQIYEWSQLWLIGNLGIVWTNCHLYRTCLNTGSVWNNNWFSNWTPFWEVFKNSVTIILSCRLQVSKWVDIT